MEPYQLLEIKRSILGRIDVDNPKPGLLDDALEQIAHIDVKRWKRVRMIFEFEFNERGEIMDAIEIRQRRPWK